MRSSVWLILAPAALVLAACGEAHKPQSAEETVFGDQVRALERARSVDEEAEQRKRELDRRIEHDSGDR